MEREKGKSVSYLIKLLHLRKQVLHRRLLYFFRSLDNSNKFLDFEQREGSSLGSNLVAFAQQSYALPDYAIVASDSVFILRHILKNMKEIFHSNGPFPMFFYRCLPIVFMPHLRVCSRY